MVRIIERIEKKSCNLIDFLFLSKTLISLTRLEDLVANVKIWGPDKRPLEEYLYILLMEIIYTTYFFYQYAFYIVGTRAYDKLQAIIMNNSILNDVKNLSPDAQTS